MPLLRVFDHVLHLSAHPVIEHVDPLRDREELLDVVDHRVDDGREQLHERAKVLVVREERLLVFDGEVDQ